MTFFFMEFLNSYHKTIKYTWDYSTSKVSLLDVSINKEEGRDFIRMCIQNLRIHTSIWISRHISIRFSAVLSAIKI